MFPIIMPGGIYTRENYIIGSNCLGICYEKLNKVYSAFHFNPDFCLVTKINMHTCMHMGVKMSYM